MGPHYPTPVRCRLLGTTAFLKGHKIPFVHADLFQELHIRKTQAWKILHDDKERRHPAIETRGRKPIITPADLQRMEEILWQYGFKARQLSWQALANEAGIKACPQTVKTAMGTLQYRKCIACEKGCVSPSNAKRRIEDAKRALHFRPKPEDWRDIRWSDECHFTICREGKIRIIRKPGERYCPDCIHHQPPDDKSVPVIRYHVWAAVGYDFKSELHFYEVPTNTNGKMSLQIYHDEILEGVVRPWLDAGQHFVLEEDGDSGHGTGRNSTNIVKDWKEAHGLKHYFNTPGSPDLSPIENCWRAVKQYVRANVSITGPSLIELVLAGWARITKASINKMVDSMVERMKAVLAGDGQMTGY